MAYRYQAGKPRYFEIIFDMYKNGHSIHYKTRGSFSLALRIQVEVSAEEVSVSALAGFLPEAKVGLPTFVLWQER